MRDHSLALFFHMEVDGLINNYLPGWRDEFGYLCEVLI